MFIRPFIPADVSQALDMLAAAFINDEFFQWLTPGRHENALSWRAWCLVSMQRRLNTPGAWGFVAADSSDPYRILGYAWWERNSASPSDDPWMQNNTSWRSMLNAWLAKAAIQFDIWTRSNRSVDYRAYSVVRGRDPEENPNVFGPLERTNHWHLVNLVVAPEHQRKGIGQMLVEHILKVADEESKTTQVPVPSTLIASTSGKGLYDKLGFQNLDWMPIPGFQGIQKGGCAMIREPSGTLIRKAPDGTKSKNGRKIDVVYSDTALSDAQKE